MTTPKIDTDHKVLVESNAWDAAQRMARFGHACGIALSGNKLPKGVTVATMTDADRIMATIHLLDRLDDATDAYVGQRIDHKVERTMQADLRAMAQRWHHYESWGDDCASGQCHQCDVLGCAVEHAKERTDEPTA